MRAANEELQRVYKAWEWDEFISFGAAKGTQWEFVPDDAPWQNEVLEEFAKSVKKTIVVEIGEDTLTFSELQTVCYESNLHTVSCFLIFVHFISQLRVTVGGR